MESNNEPIKIRVVMLKDCDELNVIDNKQLENTCYKILEEREKNTAIQNNLHDSD